jgi:hypothetical protein
MKAEMNYDMLGIMFGSSDGYLVMDFPVDGPGVWRLREMLIACGKKPKPKKMKVDLDKLIGLECAGTVIDDEGESIISAFFPGKHIDREMNEMLEEVQRLEEKFIEFKSDEDDDDGDVLSFVEGKRTL